MRSPLAGRGHGSVPQSDRVFHAQAQARQRWKPLAEEQRIRELYAAPDDRGGQHKRLWQAHYEFVERTALL
jgi:hypothetical protein